MIIHTNNFIIARTGHVFIVSYNPGDCRFAIFAIHLCDIYLVGS
jgi:hypothetical protein